MKPEQGFTLVEMMVALVIMAMIGLLSWQGLDSTLRAKQVIEQHITTHQHIQTLLSLWQSDCTSLSAQTDKQAANYVQGNQHFWLLKRVASLETQGWQIIGYSITNNTLQRVQSPTYVLKSDALGLWQNMLQEPDLKRADLAVSYALEGVLQQEFSAKFQAGVPPNQATSSSNQTSQANPQLLGMQVKWRIQNNPNPLVISCLTENRL